MSSMSQSEFEQWKTALRSALSHKDQNMAQETDRFWQQIASDSGCFDRKKLALEYLESLTSSSEVAEIFAEIRERNQVVRVKLFANAAEQSTVPSMDTSKLLLHGTSTTDKQKVMASAGTNHVYPAQGVCKPRRSYIEARIDAVVLRGGMKSEAKDCARLSNPYLSISGRKQGSITAKRQGAA
eukprot:5424169-Amphidinium_carterae.1